MNIKVDHPATRDSRHGVVTVTRRVVSQNGLLGLYRGYTMGATREGGSMGVELNWKWGWRVERMYRRYFWMTCWLLTVQFVESHCWRIIYDHYHSYIIYNQSYTYNIIFTIQYGQTFVLEGFSHQFAPALVPFFNAPLVDSWPLQEFFAARIWPSIPWWSLSSRNKIWTPGTIKFFFPSLVGSGWFEHAWREW